MRVVLPTTGAEAKRLKPYELNRVACELTEYARLYQLIELIEDQVDQVVVYTQDGSTVTFTPEDSALLARPMERALQSRMARLRESFDGCIKLEV